MLALPKHMNGFVSAVTKILKCRLDRLTINMNLKQWSWPYMSNRKPEVC